MTAPPLLSVLIPTVGRETLRRTMVALFGELGHENPLVVEYRRRLARALY